MADQISVVGGVDTHTDFHHAAAIEPIGRRIVVPHHPQRLPPPAGVAECARRGVVRRGRGARRLRLRTRPVPPGERGHRRGSGPAHRKARRANGKPDPVDAYVAATAVLYGRPKTRDGIVEAIRSLRVVSWAKLCPRTIQSGAKNTTGPSGKGNPWLKVALGEAASAAARTDTFLGARYRGIVKRRGHAKALVAVARSILVITWHLINDPDARYAA